ncbi:MAG: TonB-dependent receptor [Pseudomonadota bacterium]
MQWERLPSTCGSFGRASRKFGAMAGASFVALCAVAGMLPAEARLPDSIESSSSISGAYVHRISGHVKEHQLDIPSGSLAKALVELGKQTGVEVSTDATLLSRLRTPGLRGRYTAKGALRILLGGTNLRVKPLAQEGGLAVVPPPVRTAQATELQGIIIVGGETVERAKQESPTSATIYTGEELDGTTSASDLYDVLDRTPNAGISFGGDGFNIRGVDIRGPGIAGNGLLVGVTVDGVSLGSAISIRYGPYSTWDLEQVEVLRGPQSTQQGRNALAGQIVIRSADPIDGREVKVRQDFETLSGWRSAFAYNDQIVPGLLSFRIAGERYHSDGAVDNPILGIDDADSTNQWTGRAKVRFTPTENLEIIAGYTHSDNRGHTNLIDISKFPGRREQTNDLPSSEGNVNKIYNLRAKYKFNNVFQLTSETSYFDRANERFEDADRTPFDGGFFARDNTENSLTQETKLGFKTSWVNGAIGVYYTDIEFTDELRAIVPAFNLTDNGTSETSTKNLAFFGEADFKVVDRWTLTVGARYDREKFDSVNRRVRTVGGFPIGSAEPVFTRGEFEAFLPKVGLAYDWTSDLKTGFVVSRGYRAGGAQVSAITGESSEFDPEFTWNYEGFIRSLWFNRRLTANLNVFYTDWRDQQLIQEVTIPGTTIQDRITLNGGRSRSIGGELELNAKVSDNLNVFASFGFVDNKFTDFVTDAGDFTGNKFPSSPRFTSSFGAIYRFGGGFEVHASGHYTGEQEGDIQNDENRRIEDRFLVDAKFGYVADSWSLFVFSRNLFDVDYVNVNQAPLAFGDFDGVGDPRIVGITMKAKF